MVSVGVHKAGPYRTLLLSLLLVLPLLTWSGSAEEATLVASALYGPDTAIIGYDATTIDTAVPLADALDAEVLFDNTELGIAVVRTDDPDAVIAGALQREGVRYAERDPLVFPDHEPIDQEWPKQWGPRAIHAPEAWDVTKGSGVVVAILDTGVEWQHPDLLLSMWLNDGEIPRNTIDDDGNGYVDDIFGWDFSQRDWDPSSGSCGYHGKHVAGIVAATQDNVLGVSGVAPAAKIMALRMLCGGAPTLSLAMQAVQYAADNGANIVSCSWYSGPPSQAFEETVAWAYSERDVLFVKSAGNQYGGQVTYPGTLPEYIATSSLNQDLSISSFSSRGAKVEISAPGSNIYATYGTNGYSYLSGTSMAAPHVAGVASLIWSEDPALTNVEVRERLTDTATDLGDPGRDIVFGYGMVDAAKAVGLG